MDYILFKIPFTFQTIQTLFLLYLLNCIIILKINYIINKKITMIIFKTNGLINYYISRLYLLHLLIKLQVAHVFTIHLAISVVEFLNAFFGFSFVIYRKTQFIINL